MGAYVGAVLTLGPTSGNGGFQSYILGGTPFRSRFRFWPRVWRPRAVVAWSWARSRCAGSETDYQAMVFFVLSVSATLFVTNDIGLFNGPAGLSLIPQPLSSWVNPNSINWQWLYVGVTAVFCVIVYVFVHRVTASPLGTHAPRDPRQRGCGPVRSARTSCACGLLSSLMGNVIAGISGAVLVEFIGAWSTGSWLYVRTFVFFTSIIVGGTGNNAGVMLGALLVPVAFNELTRYLPQIGRPGFDRRAAVDRDRAARARLPLVLAPGRHSRAPAAASPARRLSPPWRRRTRRADRTYLAEGG